MTPTSTAHRTGPARGAGADRTARSAAIAVLVVLGVAFLAASWSRAGAPPGDSDEGINAAVWAYDALSLRELGPVESAMGGRRINGSAYASHPPLIVVSTSIAQSVGGEGPRSDRAAAWVGSLAAIAAAALLLRTLRVPPLPTAAGVVAGLGCHMFFTYGTMLDTPVTSLPFGILLLVGWERARQDRPLARWLLATLALAATLSGWEATLLAWLATAALAVGARQHRHRRPDVVALGAGALAGTALSFAWAWWAYGGLSEMSAKFAERSGEVAGAGIGGMVTFQLPWLAQLLGFGLVGIGATILSLRDPRWRPVAALTLATVVAFTLVFHEAAAGHQYWNYWFLLPATLGWGWAFDRLAPRLARDLQATPTTAGIAVLAVAVVVAGVNLTRPDDAGDLIDAGRRPVELVLAADLPADQTTLPYVAQLGRPDSWIVYSADLVPEALTSPQELAALAEEQPDHLVLVLGRCDEPTAALCEALDLPLLDEGGSTEPRLVPAGELAGALATGAPE